MNGETLFQQTGYFHPFPDARDVFASRVQEHAEYLLPLASVELSHLAHQWNGRIHFVAPIEPYDGVLGEDTEDFHNYLCRENWVGYRIIDGKYDLACDFRFFQKAYYANCPPKGRTLKKRYEALGLHYERTRAGHELRAIHLREQGCIHHAWAKKNRAGQYRESDRVDLVRCLGGVSLAGNWSNLGRFPIASGDFYVDDEGERWRIAHPQTEDGRLFHFIGSIPMYHYIAENPDYTCILGGDLLLFYDPQDSVALTTFDWS